MSQLHKRFTSDQVKELLDRYLKKEVERSYIQQILGIKKRRFFSLINQYREDPQHFSIQYQRAIPPRISPEVEQNILKELTIEKGLIQNKETPLKSYNYSFIKDHLRKKYRQKVSVTTVIRRAKKHGFYLKKPKRTTHDREVLTRYVGELIQHDSSYHLWAPAAQEKWYLITSLDDYSRLILYAALAKKETTWAHILALQTVILRYGLPYSYYVDSHSIFRFVQGRDSNWRKHHLLTDEAIPQWKQVLDDCNVKVTYSQGLNKESHRGVRGSRVVLPITALKQQIETIDPEEGERDELSGFVVFHLNHMHLTTFDKGKMERPYGWLQDRIVRICVREDIADIKSAQQILRQEIHRYNFQQIHSTTQEIPHFRFQKALKEKQSLFREFKISPPYKSAKDIFCLRMDRIVDPYRHISISPLKFKVHADPQKQVNLRIYPLNDEISEIRFWCDGTLIDTQKVKNSELKGMHF